MTSRSPTFDPSALAPARRRADALALFAAVLDDAPGRAFLALLDNLLARDNASPVAAAARLFGALAEHGQAAGNAGGDAWQRHLIARLLEGDTPFAARAEMVGPEGLDEAFMAQARRDLRTLQGLWALDAQTLHTAVQSAAAARNEPPEMVPAPWTALRPVAAGVAEGERARLAGALAQAGDWGNLAGALASFFRREGAGLFGRFRAFRWVRHGQSGRLEGIAAPDPIRLSGLIGYDRERAPVVRNTEQFVAGFPANNVLIYGDQGSGKSSTVKALFNEFAGQGLRLIEAPKDDLDQFHHIIAQVRGRRERFLIFVDDLSFEEQETHYKALKAILEGGIEARPDNVLLYATSNRRHLVRERHADRTAPGEDDVHVQDTLEEKISLSARFGVRVTFLAPAQQRYLDIVQGLASERRLDLDADLLRRRALAWAQQQNGRSGRTARQFIDALEGEMGLERVRAAR